MSLYIVIHSLGAQTHTHTHTITFLDKRNFKKAGAHWPKPIYVWLKIIGFRKERIELQVDKSFILDWKAFTKSGFTNFLYFTQRD